MAAAIIAVPVLAAIVIESWRQMQISSSRAELHEACEYARINVLGGMTPAQFTQIRVKGSNGYERMRKLAEAVENAAPIGSGTFEAADNSEPFTPKGVSQVMGVHEWPSLKRDPPDAEKTRLFLGATEAWSAELEEISCCDVIAQVIHDGDTYGDLLGGDSLSWGAVHFRIFWLMLARANGHALLGNGDAAVRQLLSMARLYSLVRMPLYELQLATRAWGLLGTLRVAAHWIASDVVTAPQLRDLLSLNMDCELLLPVAAEGQMASRVLWAQWVKEWPSEVWFGWARPGIEDSPFDDSDRQNKFTRGIRYREGHTTGLRTYAAQVQELRGQSPPFTVRTPDQEGLVMSANLQSASVRIHESQLEIDAARAALEKLMAK
ncbi:hypothetical protein PLCT2_02775 [Planctomycetaceae bacterium]|nr:hypothetical protein PLCT2_02775 [Planctomycetaceae bacterium]